MLTKKEIKDIQSLDGKKFRDAAGLFVVEGPKMVLELLQEAPKGFQKVYATEAWLQQQDDYHFEPTQIVTEAELQKISGLQTPNSVLAVLKQAEPKEPSAAESFCLYLDAVQDPGNVGTIIRIADWFGIKDIVCSAGCADRYNAKVVQSSMASIARINIFVDVDNNWLQVQKGVPVYAATLHGQPLQSYSKVEKGVLIIGNESKGICPEVVALATEQITIPRKGHAESLNAAVATGIILSHLI